MAERFPGFRSPNYTQVPDELFDELMAELSGAELKVLLYIIRRTFGFKRDSDNISLSQMLNGITTATGRRLDNGTGLARSSLLRVLKSLEDRSIIISTRRGSSTKGHEATNYRLNVIGQSRKPTPTPQSPTSTEDGSPSGHSPKSGPPLDSKSAYPLGRKQVLPLDSKSASQDTVRQETESVNVNALSEPQKLLDEDGKREALVFEMLDVLGDRHSTGLYRRIARHAPEDLIFETLAETKYQANMGRVQKTRGAVFTDLIKRRAKELGIDLGLH